MQALPVSELDIVCRLGQDEIDLLLMDGGFEFWIGQRYEFQPAAADVGVQVIDQRLLALDGFRLRAKGQYADAGGECCFRCRQCQQRKQAKQNPKPGEPGHAPVA